jgi:hypothetical protein
MAVFWASAITARSMLRCNFFISLASVISSPSSLTEVTFPCSSTRTSTGTEPATSNSGNLAKSIRTTGTVPTKWAAASSWSGDTGSRPCDLASWRVNDDAMTTANPTTNKREQRFMTTNHPILRSIETVRASRNQRQRSCSQCCFRSSFRWQ